MWVITKAILGIIAILAIAGLGSNVVNAQATRTWVSGVGDDANPCSRMAPCKTFAGAISKTAAGGEISVLDPGGYGAVTITKSITINGDGTLAGILAAGTNGVIINAGDTGRVILRNISFAGVGAGLNGVRVLAAANVTIDKCTIYGFANSAISVENAAATTVVVKDTYISNVATGIRLAGTTASVANLQNVNISAVSRGVDVAVSGAAATIDSSVILRASIAAIATTAGTGAINMTNSVLTNNAIAVSAGVSGSVIRLSSNRILNNPTGFSVVAGASIASLGNNMTGGNGGAGAPNLTLTPQ